MTGQGPCVLVIGGTGFIGSSVLGALLAAGFKTTALAFDDRGQPARLQGIENLDVLSVASSRPDDLVARLSDFPFDYVINLAAGGVDPKDRSPVPLLESNAGFLLRLLEAISANPPRLFVHTGSWSEYAPAEHGHRLSEDHSLCARSLYGGAKAAATVSGNGYAASLGLPFVTLRLFHVYGPGEPDHRLLPYVIKRLDKGQPAELTSGRQVRDFLHVEDVAGAYVAALRCENLQPFQAYNLCSGLAVSVQQVAETLADAMERPRDLLRFGALPDRADESVWVVGDNARFEVATGWRPRLDLDGGVRQSVARIRAGGSGNG